MVSVELIGGLGNQMFQIAACIAYAKKHNLEYHIPVKTQNSHSSKPYFTDMQNPKWDESLPTVVYQEPHFHYVEIPGNLHDRSKENLILSGYFQSYKYFEGENLGRLFRDSLLRTVEQKDFLHPKVNCVAVHVRQGDYELYPSKHPIVSVDYISSAIEHFKVYNPEQVSFFSDNPVWCAQFAHMRKMSCSVVFEYDPIKSFLELMTYDCFVLSNSTFGYWAAIMREWLWPKGVRVFYPRQWFGPDYADKDTKDLCPPSWGKM